MSVVLNGEFTVNFLSFLLSGICCHFIFFTSGPDYVLEVVYSSYLQVHSLH